MSNTNNLEILKTLQSTLNILVSQQEEERDRERGYREVMTYKRNKAELMTAKEAAKEYPIGEAKFRELCRSTNKGFPSIKIGCRYYIIKDKLDDWFRANAGSCL
ncbi:helix-turn-helix domain-containing protein [Romboutsia sp. Marseille-P6047]|uniref:helix-turn-helix domain-containing protein n=1 Tax=Romboutsia sp. Marseille-P6047 TaxID=2161817 RepID=UPI000F06CFC6|nr:helix-turn-helix domain-containing protein [Romboutsia sp. Marseille-P6047]